MFEPLEISAESGPYGAFGSDYAIPSRGPALDIETEKRKGLLHGLARRLRREVRRRKVGRAYDMALEVARVVPEHSRLLDVGCGNGFIAHHLSAMLSTNVLGLDLGKSAEAAIPYRQFDGRVFPVDGRSFDAVLLCYVLHHAQDVGAVIDEVRRTLSEGGLAIVYEDIPECWWDRLVCWMHNLKWRTRTGPCAFRGRTEWEELFKSAGFEIVSERRLSRWRNLAHPVKRNFFLLKLGPSADLM